DSYGRYLKSPVFKETQKKALSPDEHKFTESQLEQNARSRRPSLSPIVMRQLEQERRAKMAAAAPVDITQPPEPFCNLKSARVTDTTTVQSGLSGPANPELWGSSSSLQICSGLSVSCPLHEDWLRTGLELEWMQCEPGSDCTGLKPKVHSDALELEQIQSELCRFTTPVPHLAVYSGFSDSAPSPPSLPLPSGPALTSACPSPISLALDSTSASDPPPPEAPPPPAAPPRSRVGQSLRRLLRRGCGPSGVFASLSPKCQSAPGGGASGRVQPISGEQQGQAPPKRFGNFFQIKVDIPPECRIYPIESEDGGRGESAL
ncbi:hypothetical protein WMY93_033377, partial [Mugilogobius chulae]